MKKYFPVSLLVLALIGCSTSNTTIEKEIASLSDKMNGEVYHDREILQQQEILREELVERGHMAKREYILLDSELGSTSRSEVFNRIEELLVENDYKPASVETRGHLINFEEKGLVVTVFDNLSTIERWDDLIETLKGANKAE